MIVSVLFRGETSPWGITALTLIVLLPVALVSTQLN